MTYIAEMISVLNKMVSYGILLFSAFNYMFDFNITHIQFGFVEITPESLP